VTGEPGSRWGAGSRSRPDPLLPVQGHRDAVENVDPGTPVGAQPGPVGVDGERDVRVPEHSADVVDVRPGLEVEGGVGVPEAVGGEAGGGAELAILAPLVPGGRRLADLANLVGGGFRGHPIGAP